MRILFLGAGPAPTLLAHLTDLGHTVAAPVACDWWGAMFAGRSPADYADAAGVEIARFAPDWIVGNKLGHYWRDGRLWAPPARFLAWCASVARFAYLSWDDPAFAPVALAQGLVAHAEVWFTSCPGIVSLPDFAERTRARVCEFWLAWDECIPLPVVRDPACEVDLAITGSPYHEPFPLPHYQHGFGRPRRDFVRAALECGYTVGLWGPNTWLSTEHGGCPTFAQHYRGWLDPSRVHVVHASARVCLATHLVEGWRYDSGRLPWTLGAGGCLLHEARPGLEQEFGGTVAWFPPHDVSCAIDRLGVLLAQPETRAKMATDGQTIVLARHTWRHRAQTMSEELLR